MRVNAVGDEMSADTNDGLARTLVDHSEQSVTIKGNLAPQAEYKTATHMGLYGQFRGGESYKVYASAVKFADASVWKDDGSHACAWTRDWGKH